MDGAQAIEIIRGTGRTKAEIARAIGVSETAVQKWGRGGRVSGTTESLLLLIRERPEVVDVLKRIKGG